MSQISLFLFDLDGTLVSTGGAGLRALNGAFSGMFGIHDVTSFVNPSGMTDPAIFRQIILKKFNRTLEAEELSRIGRRYLSCLELEMQNPPGFAVLPGVREFVHFLFQQEDALLGLGTGNLEEGARMKLEPAHLNPFFHFGGFGSDAESRPRLLQIGLERAQAIAGTAIRKTNVYVIGDTVLDVRAAREAGFKSVAVAAGGSSYEELRAVDPDTLLRDLTCGADFYEKIRSGNNKLGS